MPPTSTSGGYHYRCPTGGEHIPHLVETRRGKKIFLQSKNFLLMRYKSANEYLIAIAFVIAFYAGWIVVSVGLASLVIVCILKSNMYFLPRGEQ